MEATNQKEHWTELYRRALFEEDPQKLPFLLERAHRAVQARVRELWYSPSPRPDITERERHELDAAAYYLEVLRSLEARNLDVGQS